MGNVSSDQLTRICWRGKYVRKKKDRLWEVSKIIVIMVAISPLIHNLSMEYTQMREGHLPETTEGLNSL